MPQTNEQCQCEDAPAECIDCNTMRCKVCGKTRAPKAKEIEAFR